MSAPRKQDADTGKTVYDLTDTESFNWAAVYLFVRIMFTNIKFNSFNDTWTFEYENHLGIQKRKKKTC